jgi:hypothetical protein
MAGDARDLPLSTINSKSDYVVYSGHLGVLAECITATDAVKFLLQHMRAHPRSDAIVLKKTAQAWRILLLS